MVIFSNPSEKQGCQISQYSVARYSFFKIYLKTDDKDIKIGITPYFALKSRSVIISKPSKTYRVAIFLLQGCQILKFQISIYFDKNYELGQKKIAITPYFGPVSRFMILSRPYSPQGCQILHYRIARYSIFQIISRKIKMRHKI